MPRRPSDKRKLTDRFVASRKLAAPGMRDTYLDNEVANFALRVTDRGAKSFVVNLRWPGSRVPERRTVGDARHMPLAEARRIARGWLEKVERGVDPREEERRIRIEEARSRAMTFGGVAVAFIAEDLAGKRRASRDAAEIRRHIIPRWRHRAINEIKAGDVLALVRDLKSKPATARLVLSHIKRIYNFAIHEGIERFGIEHSPAAVVSPKRVFGTKEPRQRNLDDRELRALWRAATEVGYPAGDCIKLLMLTGCRREEIARAKWPEIDLDRRLLVIPPARFKSGVTHMVPLSTPAVELVKNLPHHNGPHVFTTTFGKKAIDGWSRTKTRIEALMAKELGSPAPRWVFHDLRHTMRTRMAAAKVPDLVAELCLGHAKRGMQRVYDEHSYEPEMREALQGWAESLLAIATKPEGDNVVAMAKRRRATM